MKNHRNRPEILSRLPFEFKRAVLTQARTAKIKPYAFIVEFHDGCRRFVKGPFNSVDSAQGHVICNMVKRMLGSQYLHPVQCEVRNYGDQRIFLECDEIGRADLNNVTLKRTKLESTQFEVLTYDSNDVVPDPLSFLRGVNDNNRNVWIEVMVNYCFRWVFGIGDTARRNLMLQRSTGYIYSTDETGIETVNHANIWGGKKPDKKTFESVRAFVESEHLGEVLTEVERWKGCLDWIRREVYPLSDQVEARIDRLLDNPTIVFDI